MRGWGGRGGGRAAVPLLAEAGRDRGGCAVGGAVQAGAAFSEKLLGAVASEAAPGPRAVRLACALPASASFRWRDEAAARFPLSPGRAGARSRGDAGARGPARPGPARLWEACRLCGDRKCSYWRPKRVRAEARRFPSHRDRSSWVFRNRPQVWEGPGSSCLCFSREISHG